MNLTITKQKKTFKDIIRAIGKGFRLFAHEFIFHPLFLLAHPIKGFDEFKRERKGKMWVACVFIAFLVFLNITEYRFTGYIASNKDITDLKTLSVIFQNVLTIGVISVANWMITTLFDGKGKLKEIFMMLSYCLFPLVWAKLLSLFVSNVITEQEEAVYSLIMGLGTFLMCYMAFFGFIGIHEYGVVKCCLSLLGTAIATLLVCFITLLGFDLFKKMYGFIHTIYSEISLRYF